MCIYILAKGRNLLYSVDFLCQFWQMVVKLFLHHSPKLFIMISKFKYRQNVLAVSGLCLWPMYNILIFEKAIIDCSFQNIFTRKLSPSCLVLQSANKNCPTKEPKKQEGYNYSCSLSHMYLYSIHCTLHTTTITSTITLPLSLPT